MTWEIEADVDIAPNQQLRIVRSLIGFFAGSTEWIRVRVTRGDWPIERLCERTFDGPGDIDDVVGMITRERAADRTIVVMTGLRDAAAMDYRPRSEVYLFGDEVLGHGNHRRRAPVTIAFGSREAWRGEATLPSGLELGEETLARALRHVCMEARPSSLYMGPEEQASIPFNDHFVFHSEPHGWTQDLADIVQLCLYGGHDRYADARGRYEAALGDASTMLFCKRSGEWLSATRRFLAAQLPRLEKRGVPSDLSFATIEDALLACDDLQFFFTDAGLGIYTKTLFGSYVEGFYLSLIERLVADVADTKTGAG